MLAKKLFDSIVEFELLFVHALEENMSKPKGLAFGEVFWAGAELEQFEKVKTAVRANVRAKEGHVEERPVVEARNDRGAKAARPPPFSEAVISTAAVAIVGLLYDTLALFEAALSTSSDDMGDVYKHAAATIQALKEKETPARLRLLRAPRGAVDGDSAAADASAFGVQHLELRGDELPERTKQRVDELSEEPELLKAFVRRTLPPQNWKPPLTSTQFERSLSDERGASGRGVKIKGGDRFLPEERDFHQVFPSICLTEERATAWGTNNPRFTVLASASGAELEKSAKRSKQGKQKVKKGVPGAHEQSSEVIK